jgi:chloride channel protein, CIC family
MSPSERWQPALLRGVLPRRLRAWIVLSVVVGVITGAGVSVLNLVIERLAWGPLSGRDAIWIAALPLLGLIASTWILGRTSDRSTDTTESYIEVFHDQRGHVPVRDGLLRLGASIATISLGGALGLEGPSVFLGAMLGDVAERRFADLFDREDARMLLVAGAAAGISAIFKAPVTGTIFALEVPYRDDLARHALLPAIFASAAGYLTFGAVVGIRPLFPVQQAGFRYLDLLVALFVGLACGVASRVFVGVLRAASALAQRMGLWTRAIVAGIVLFVVGALSLWVFHAPLALGPGYNAILRAAQGRLALPLLVALLALKMVATPATVAGNGVGGLFFPSVLMGATVGGALGHLFPGPPSLFAVVGIAAFLGGAYKVPLAGVAFVAETTGAPGYIIPGLLAAALGFLASGEASVSRRQRFRRPSHLERRLDLTVSDVMTRDWVEVPPDATLQEFVSRYVVQSKSKSVAVAEAGTYHGMLSLDQLRTIRAERWPVLRARDVMASEGYPTTVPSAKLSGVLADMRAARVDRIAVLAAGRIVGMLATSDVLRLDEVLETVREQRDDHAE